MNITRIAPTAKGTRKAKRVISLDILKCFAIFLVLWAHAIQHLTTADCVENSLFRLIYSFHMPLFMMVSGYFSVRSMEMTFPKFIEKKLKQIALPGFVWQFLFVLVSVMFCYGNISLSLNPTQYMPFWFLWALLICNLLSYIGKRFKYGRSITLLASQFIPFANVIFMYPAFIVGQLIWENKLYFQRNIQRILFISASIYILLMLFWGSDDWHLRSQTQDRIVSSGYFSAGLFYCWKTAYKIIVNLSGGVMFFGLFVMSEKLWNNHVGKIFSYIGRYTLIVYILQFYILEAELPKFVCLDFLFTPVFNFVATPLIAIAVLLCCVAVATIVDKNRYSRFILLGR